MKNSVKLEHIQSLMEKVDYRFLRQSKTVTICSSFLNDFLIAIGTSACIDAENFNEELGKKIAQEKVERLTEDKLWELEGWRLMCEIDKKAGLAGS